MGLERGARILLLKAWEKAKQQKRHGCPSGNFRGVDKPPVSLHPKFLFVRDALSWFPPKWRNVWVNKRKFAWAAGAAQAFEHSGSQQRQFMRANDKHRLEAHPCIHVRMHMRHRQFYANKIWTSPTILKYLQRTDIHAPVCLLEHAHYRHKPGLSKHMLHEIKTP
jgi:hypothetical protein